MGASYFYENSSQNVNAKANLQYLYPVFIQKSVKASLSSQIDNVKGLLSQYLPGAYLPMVDVALAQLMSKWFPENPEKDADGKLKALTTTPDIYGDLKTALGAVGMDLDRFLLAWTITANRFRLPCRAFRPKCSILPIPNRARITEPTRL